jgi:hypothetical protein
MNLARFNIDVCKYVAWREQVRLPIVQFVDAARALINGGNFHRINILNQYL